MPISAEVVTMWLQLTVVEAFVLSALEGTQQQQQRASNSRSHATSGSTTTAAESAAAGCFLDFVVVDVVGSLLDVVSSTSSCRSVGPHAGRA